METIRIQIIDHEASFEIITSEIFNENSEEIFLRNFQEFTLEEDLDEFNPKFLEETNSFFNYVA